MIQDGSPQAPVQLPSSVVKRGRLTGTRDAKIWYSSNPFLAAIQGMVIGLLENSVAILLIPIVALGIIAASGLIPILASAFLTHTQTSIVLAMWLGAISLVALFALSLHLQLMIASFHQERISVHNAIDRTLQRPLGFFGVVAICFVLPAFACIIIFQAMDVASVLLGGFLLIPSLFIIARFWLAAYFFYDQRDDLGTSLANSWKLTSGRTFEMLGVMAAQFPLCILGILSPLIASSGFTTRYFQLRYVKSHDLDTGIRIHWLNYFLALALVLGSGYIVFQQVHQVRDNNVQVCYIQDSTAPAGSALQVCQTRRDCRRDPVCNNRDLNNDPTFTVVE